MIQANLVRLDSVIQTVAFCELPSSITATVGITNFAPQVAVVKSKVVIIQSYNLLGSSTTKGVTLNLIGIRTAMCQNTYVLANALVAYGASLTPPDNNIIQTAKLTAGSLENMTKQQCVTKCDAVQQLAAANAAGILPFGASATVITDTASLVTLYYNGIDDPRGAKITRTNANNQALQTLNDVISVELELKLDTMANTLRYTNNEWWIAYRASREIIDSASFTTVLKLKVINGATGDPLTGAKVYHNAGPDFKKSTKRGYVTYKDIEQGNHTFVLKHKKFNALLVPQIPIGYGNKKTVTVVMMPLGTVSNGNNVIAEGDIPAGNIFNLDVSEIGVTFSSTVRAEISGGQLNIYAAETLDEQPGATFWHLTDGTDVTKTLPEFAVLIGSSETKKKVTLQNPGTTTTHYKITFMNLDGE